MRDRLKALLLAAGLALVFLAFLAPVTAALAQNMFGGDPIADIKIEGTQRIEADTVRSYMQLNPGDPFAPDRIDKALKNLFATGLFADVAFRREGNTLIVKVVENPIINTIAFEGNDYLESKDLFAEIQEKPRTVLTQSRVQADVQRILNLYRRSGRFGATVDPKIIKLDQNRVNLVFEIKEGSRTDVRKISFVGNKSFSDSELRGVILTTETAWYRFLVTTDTYDPDRLQVDRDRLRDFYLMNGYIDFKVISAVAELSPEQDAFFITFSLDEGERYKVGKVDVKTSLKDLDPEVLRSLVQVKEGEWYDQRDVDKTTAALNDALGSLGYAFVDVQNRLDRDPKKKTVNITFSINEGPKVYVERIDIKGNARTLDSVIRREFRLVEGDAFNSSKLQRTKQRLTNLGFFSQRRRQDPARVDAGQDGHRGECRGAVDRRAQLRSRLFHDQRPPRADQDLGAEPARQGTVAVPRHQPVLRHLQHHAELHRALFPGPADLRRRRHLRHGDPEHQQHLREFQYPLRRVGSGLRAARRLRHQRIPAP